MFVVIVVVAITLIIVIRLVEHFHNQVCRHSISRSLFLFISFAVSISAKWNDYRPTDTRQPLFIPPEYAILHNEHKQLYAWNYPISIVVCLPFFLCRLLQLLKANNCVVVVVPAILSRKIASSVFHSRGSNEVPTIILKFIVVPAPKSFCLFCLSVYQFNNFPFCTYVLTPQTFSASIKFSMSRE